MTIRTDPPRDHAGLEVLGYDECLRLAGSEPVGRIAFAQGGDIHVFPINHCLLDGLMAFRTAEGAKLGAAMEGSVVAFETDHYDAEPAGGLERPRHGRGGARDRQHAAGPAARDRPAVMAQPRVERPTG